MLAYTVAGGFPDKYAFYKGYRRNFRVEFAATDREYSVVLFERTDAIHYENCFARGVFSDLDRLVMVIHCWVGDLGDISGLKMKFDELELFEDIEYVHPNEDIDRAWTKVKNMLFNYTGFWKQREWENRYNELLLAAKKCECFAAYYPFCSHHWLRFSIDKEHSVFPPLSCSIMPAWHTLEKPNIYEKPYVCWGESPSNDDSFETAEEALDTYAKKLAEVMLRNEQ